MTPIHIGTKQIGPDAPNFIIAELSGNHGGDLEKALKLLRAAHAAGADAIKIQVYRPDTITLNSDKPDFAIAADNAWARYKNLYNLYEYAHTPWEWLPYLFEEADKLGIELFGSVFDETAVDELERYNNRAYKIASPEIVDMSLLSKVAQTGKPVIVSTGLANLVDIARAVNHLRQHGCNDIILLKCTTAYPTPPEEVNLRTIQNLSDTFDCIAGLSDHTIGMGVALASVALGSCVLEKHIKLDDDEETVDSFFSLTTDEFKNMIIEMRRAEAAIGKVNFDLTPEAKKNKNGRRSLYVSAPIPKGGKLTQDNIKSVRPGFGLAPRYKEAILGRTVKKDMDVGDRLSWEILE
jgi:N-acetylneuraminate synthase/pseudaminic acid synthase